MKNSSFAVPFALLTAMLFGLFGCSTEFEVYAPEKPISVVYGVLNPADTFQYIRISRAYQVEGDAIAYAGENNLSITGLNVRLSGGNNNWVAEEVDGIQKDTNGIFVTDQILYRFRTDGSSADHQLLEGGVTYQLEIGTPDAGDYITSQTTIPTLPQIRGSLSLISGSGQTTCLPNIFLDRRFQAFWRKSEGNNIKYELRVILNFQDDGEERSVVWKNLGLIENNVRCNQGSNVICYQFEEYQLLNYFKRFMPEDGSIYTYDSKDSCAFDPADIPNLPEPVVFEVTAVDEFLGNYLTVNDPSLTDLTGAKPEYTNMSGNMEAYGIFGSIHTDQRSAILRECSKAVLGLNGQPFPPDCDPIEN